MTSMGMYVGYLVSFKKCESRYSWHHFIFTNVCFVLSLNVFFPLTVGKIFTCCQFILYQLHMEYRINISLRNFKFPSSWFVSDLGTMDQKFTDRRRKTYDTESKCDWIKSMVDQIIILRVKIYLKTIWLNPFSWIMNVDVFRWYND